MKETPRIRSCVSCPSCRFRRYRFASAQHVQETPGLRTCQVCGDACMDVFDMERGGVVCEVGEMAVPDAERVALTAAETDTAARLLGSIFP